MQLNLTSSRSHFYHFGVLFSLCNKSRICVRVTFPEFVSFCGASEYSKMSYLESHVKKYTSLLPFPL